MEFEVLVVEEPLTSDKSALKMYEALKKENIVCNIILENAIFAFM